jgi:hypothetical protein
MRGDIVQLKVAENVKIDVSRQAITKVLNEAANGVVLSGDKA